MPTIAFDAIGVRWEIDTDAPLRDTTRAVIRERIETYDRTWSRYRTDSLVSAIADAPGTWRLPPEADPLLELYRQLHEATDGRVSPLAAAGRPARTWADAIAWDGEWLQAPRPVELDVAAAGKGQLVDLVTEVLADHGIDECTVDGSGDLRRRGGPIRVGLEHPEDRRLAVGVVELADAAIAASAPNRQPGHILDATTGLPVAGTAATWAIADTALIADGVATALFFTEDLPSTLGAQWARMDTAGRIRTSPDWPGEVFT